MIELFIELTDQIFWEGYAEQLAGENSAVFQQGLNEFMNSYNLNNQQKTTTTNNQADERHRFFIYQSNHTDQPSKHQGCDQRTGNRNSLFHWQHKKRAGTVNRDHQTEYRRLKLW